MAPAARAAEPPAHMLFQATVWITKENVLMVINNSGY
jgi:hypothetical protein